MLSTIYGVLSGKSAIILVVIALMAGSGYAGYRAADNVWMARQSKIYQQWADSLIEADKARRERERELLSKLRVASAKTKTIIKTIPASVTSDGCRIDDDGMQRIRSHVSELFRNAG